MNRKTRMHCAMLAVVSTLAMPGGPAVAAATYDTGTSGVARQADAPRSIDAPRHITLEQPGTPFGLAGPQDRAFDQSPLQSTGIWVERGDKVTVTLDIAGRMPDPMPQAWLAVPRDPSYHYGKAQKVELGKGKNSFTADRDGILYIVVFNAPTGGTMSVDIQGGQSMPRFVLGRHDNSDLPRMLDKFRDVPYVEFVGNRMMITAERGVVESDADDPTAMLKTWDTIVGLAEEQYGLVDDKNSDSVHRRIGHRFHWIDARDNLPGTECHGYMNSGSYGMAACSPGAMDDVISHRQLTTESWGAWHELGHQFQMQSFEWSGMTEVTVNLTSMYVQRALGLKPIMEDIDNDPKWNWRRVFDYLAREHRDFNALDDVRIQVGMFWQLDLTFGKDFYARLGRRYREMPMSERPRRTDEQVQRFILETSRVAGYDLTSFFEKWGLPVDSGTRARLRELGLPELTDPIWENRDFDIKYDYSQAAAGPQASVGKPWHVVASSNWGFAYALDGNGSAGDGLTYQWRVRRGRFPLREPGEKQAKPVVTTAVAEAVVPKNSTGVTEYELTVTDKHGRTATSTTTVTAVAPQATIHGDSSTPANAAASFRAEANFRGGTMSYAWKLRDVAGRTVATGEMPEWSAPAGLRAGNYRVEVVVRSTSGARQASASHELRVTEVDNGGGSNGDGQYPPYVAGASSQVPGSIVRSRDGKLYQCKPAPYGGWCSVNSALYYEPGFGLAWRDAWTPYRD